MSDIDLEELLREIDRARTPLNGITLLPELHASSANFVGESYVECGPLSTKFQDVQVDSLIYIEPINPRFAIAGILLITRLAGYTHVGSQLKLFEGEFQPVGKDGELRPCYGNATRDGFFQLVDGPPDQDAARVWLARTP